MQHSLSFLNGGAGRAWVSDFAAKGVGSAALDRGRCSHHLHEESLVLQYCRYGGKGLAARKLDGGTSGWEEYPLPTSGRKSVPNAAAEERRRSRGDAI